MRFHTEYLTFQTRRRQEIIDITERVAEAVIAVVERGDGERYVPGLLRGAVVARTLAPGMARWATRFVFRRELGAWRDPPRA